MRFEGTFVAVGYKSRFKFFDSESIQNRINQQFLMKPMFRAEKEKAKVSPPRKLKEIEQPPFDNSELGKFCLSIHKTKETISRKQISACSKIILTSIFEKQNFEAAATELFSTMKSSSKPVCGKILTVKDIGFKCLDCEKDPTCIICKDCFENADHKGHRIIVQKHVAGCCDCGDPDAWKESGFCKNHPGYAKFKPNVSVTDLPEKFRKNFTEELSKAFYYLCLCLEKSVAEGDNVNTPSIFKAILDVIEFCGSQNMVVYNLVCQLLQQSYPGKCWLYHTCKDLQEKEYSGKLKECQCSLLEILFRNQRFLTGAEQQEFQELMIKLFLDYEFKKYIAETYIKMLYFVYNFFGVDSPFYEFHLSSLAVQLFTAEDFAAIAIKSTYCKHMIELFELVAKNFSGRVESSFRLLMEVYQLLQFVSQKSHCRQLLLKTQGFFEGLLMAVAPFQYVVKFAPNMPILLSFEEIDNQILFADVEFYLTKYCDIMFQEVSNIQDIEVRQMTYKRVATIFKEIFSTQKEHEDNMRSLHIPVYRAFSQFVKAGAGSFETEVIRRFLLDSFGFDDQQLSVFCLRVFKEVLYTLGFVRDQEKRCWEKYGTLLDSYVKLYFNEPRVKFFDLDFFLLQTMARFVEQHTLFHCLVSEYSSYQPYIKFIKMVLSGSDNPSLKAAITNLDSEAQEKLLAKIDELANLFLQLNIEDTEYANLQTKSEKFFGESKPDTEKNELSPEQVAIYKRLLINIFQYKPTFDMKRLKKTLSAHTIEDKVNLEVPLFEVASLDSTTKAFTIKSQYKDVYEPFSFMKDMQLQIEIIESLKSKLKGSDELDLIIGKRSFLYDTDGNQLFQLQKYLFSKQFFEFFKRILSICIGLEKTSPFFFRPFLKLIHLGLFHLEKKSLNALKPVLTDAEMTKILKNAALDDNFADYENSIEKMLSMISKLNSSDENEMNIEPVSNITRQPSSKIDLEVSKKKQMELKMKFLQKQKLFMQQHGNHLPEESKSGEKKSEELLCYLCHSKIEPETQVFGVPGYAFQSNIYDFAVFQTNMRTIVEENVAELLPSFRDEASKYDLKSQNFDPCMQLNSCSHTMHKKCFETSKTVPQDINFHFNNEIEFFCKVCKRLSNVFIESYLSNQKKPGILEKQVAMEQETTLKSVDQLLGCIKKMMTKDQSKKSEYIEVEGESKNLLFDTLIMLEILMSANNSAVNDREDSILGVTEKIFEYAVKAVDILGVKHFLTKNLELYRSLRIMYLRYYSQYKSQNKKVFSSAKYEKLIEFVELSATESPKFRDDDNANFITTNLDDFFYNSLVHLAVTSQLSEAHIFLKEVLSRLCYLAILQAILKVYWIKIIKTKTHNQPELGADQFFRELKESHAFRVEVAKSLLPLMRRLIVLGFLFDPFAEDSEMKVFQQEEFFKDFEELDFYLNYSLFKTTSNTLFSEEILNKCLLKKEMLEKHFQKLLKALNSGTSSIPLTFVFSSKEVSFHLIDLPDNYLDLSKFYIDQKCVLCMDHSQLGSKCVCLICEQVICSYACKKGANLMLGNLNTHATKYHAGCTALLSVESGSVILINSPKNIEYGALYVDKFGQRFTGKNPNWEEYSLDRDMLNKLKEIIQKNSIPQEICYQLIKSEKKIFDGIL